MTSRFRYRLAVLAFVPLVFVAAGCGGQGTETQCSLSACTVTLDRGVDAEASILGMKVQLVGVKGSQVTLNVAGQEVTVPAGGQTTAEGFNVAVQDVTQDTVVVKVSRQGGGEQGEQGGG
ncbi:MAG TPA: hypothetical protein VFU43_19585 [Streptosporangiaceae bacterium]|nr:hypothetical protein [Streptosporangiaceae bacterium]